MGEPWKHDAQREKPDAEGHTVCDSISVRRPEQANPRRQKVGDWLPGAAGRGQWGVTANGGVESPFGVMEMLWNYQVKVVGAHHCECAECHPIAPLKMVNFTPI